MISISNSHNECEAPMTGTSREESHVVQRYRVWRKHVRDLYQTVFVHLLDYPSTTVQVLPYVRKNYKHSTIEHTLVSGSCRDTCSQSYISIMKAVTPSYELGTSLPMNSETAEVGGYGHAPSTSRLHTEMRMYHDGGVRRVRYVPWNPNILVSISTDGNGYVFDKTEIAISKKPNNPSRPLLPLLVERCEEPEEENSMNLTQESKRQKFATVMDEQQKFDADNGKGQHKMALSGGDAGIGPAPLDVSVNESGTVASGSQHRLLIWDILDYQCSPNEPDRKAQPTLFPRAEKRACGEINDVKLSKSHPNIVYSACENKHGACIFDSRTESAVLYASTVDYPVSVDPSPFVEHCFALGMGSGKIEFRDNRKLQLPISQFQAHAPDTEVTSLLWSVHNPTLLASAGEDCNVVFTDYPEGKLRFKHAGHTSTVDDISWSWIDSHKGMMASISSEDNLCMLWKPRNHIWKKQ